MRILLLVTAAALLLGVFPLPIGYYTFLRLLVCLAAILVIVNDYRGRVEPVHIVFGLMALLFNPLFPVYLHNKTFWRMLDIVAAGIFLVKGLGLLSTSPSKE